MVNFYGRCLHMLWCILGEWKGNWQRDIRQGMGTAQNQKTRVRELDSLTYNFFFYSGNRLLMSTMFFFYSLMFIFVLTTSLKIKITFIVYMRVGMYLSFLYVYECERVYVCVL